MIPLTTDSEALWMTACPACGAHKGVGVLLCLACCQLRKDIVPFAHTGMSFAVWLRYALSGNPVMLVKPLLEPGDLKDNPS